MSTSAPTITCASHGDLVSTTAKAFREKIEQAINAALSDPLWTLLELDLRSAQFIDSVGINLIILFIRKMKERGGSVRILISNSNLRRVLVFMRIDQHAEIVLS